MVEITSEEQNKVKRMKTTEDSHRDLWDNYRGARRRGEKKGYEKIFEEIIVENFPNMEKNSQSCPRAAKAPIQDKSKENTPRHILTKLTKTKHKERILKAAREKQQATYRETPHV